MQVKGKTWNIHTIYLSCAREIMLIEQPTLMQTWYIAELAISYLFPNTPFWNRPKFKEAADDNWNVAIKGF